MTDQMLGWLREQIQEDKAAAKRVRQPYRLYVCDDGCLEEPLRVEDLYGLRDGEYQQWDDGEDRLPNHHNSWLPILDPRDRIADCEAKLRILDCHQPSDVRECRTCFGAPGRSVTEPSFYMESWPCSTVRLLAEAYRHRPGWKEEWTP